MIPEHKKDFLRLLAQKLYNDRVPTENGCGVSDLRELGLPEDEWQWVKDELYNIDQEAKCQI